MLSAEEARKKIEENQINYILEKIQKELEGGSISNTFNFNLGSRLLPEAKKRLEELGWTVNTNYPSAIRDVSSLTITISC